LLCSEFLKAQTFAEKAKKLSARESLYILKVESPRVKYIKYSSSNKSSLRVFYVHWVHAQLANRRRGDVR